MLTPHPSSALEYWFFKVNHGSMALIVDWIERRKLNEHVLRVSIHAPQGREVMFEKLDSFMPSGNFLSPTKAVGHTGAVAWDLDIELGSEHIKPDIFPVGLLKLPDTLYESAPVAKFTGWIRYGDETISLDHVDGAVIQYWGRQLAQEWWWLSTHQFDREGMAVECSVFRTSLWGTALQMPFAFLYLYRDGKREFLLAPPHSARVDGLPDRFTIAFKTRGGRRIALAATGREYGDFGERISNTLTGDLDVFEDNQLIASARGTAALERRTPKPISAQ